MKTTDDLVRIANHGGSIVIDNSKTTDDVVRIANHIVPGSTLTIKKASQKTTDDLVRIANHGKPGKIIFDFTE